MPSTFFYNPDREVPTFAGDCFVPMYTDPATQSRHVLGRGDRRLHAVGKPRGGFFVVGKPRPLRAAAYLLGRPPPALGGKPARVRGSPLGGVYVLEKADGSFYVGKSGNIPERIRQHAAGEGASCARGFVRRVTPITEENEADPEAWERSETLARMHRHGISRVRGWMYTTPSLTEAQRDHAFGQVCERMDLCRRCGMGGHFAAACRRPASVSSRPEWAQ